ncbi:MAG: hypothetical protein Q7S02_00400 [bacterium]|nr:hypothetical protein [bacterium]
MDLYRPIITTAWGIALRARHLWWFALFGGLLIGSGFGSAIIQTLNANPAQSVLAQVLDLQTTSPDRISALWEQARATGWGATVALSAYGLLLLAFLAIIIWFAVIGVNAIVVAASRAPKSPSSSKELRRAAHARFWPTLGIHVIAKGTEAILLAAWGAVLIASAVQNTPFVNARAILAFVVTAVLLTCIHIIAPYAITSAVLDRRNALTALREAFALLRDHWFITIEASLLLTLTNIVAIAVWLAGGALLALPFLFLGGIAITKGASTLFSTALIGGIITLAIWLACIAMVFTTFLVSAWTLLFLRLTSTGERPQSWFARRFTRE